MRSLQLAFIMLLLCSVGCRIIKQLPGLPRNRECVDPPTTHSTYHAANWSWAPVARVLILPPYNTSSHNRASEEFQASLASEFQRLGRFEVIQAGPETLSRISEVTHRTGRFDEVVLFELAKEARADIILATTITQYSPYPRPRIGLTLQAISALDGKVIASVDGLWDTSDSRVAENVRKHYRQHNQSTSPWVRNHSIANDDNFTAEIALNSPVLFQRWISHKVAYELIGEIDPDDVTPASGLDQLKFRLSRNSCPPPAPTPTDCPPTTKPQNHCQPAPAALTADPTGSALRPVRD